MAKRCAARIRYLCFRLDSLDPIVQDFDDRARQVCSKWKYKPLQERGTIPILPVTKSFLAGETKAKRVLGLVKLSNEQRQYLLRLVDEVLQDDYELARASDSYSRSVTPSIHRSLSPTTPAPHPTHYLPKHNESVAGEKQYNKRGLAENLLSASSMGKVGSRSTAPPEVS